MASREALKGPFQSISNSKFVAADLTVHLKVLLRRFFVIIMSKFVCRNDICTSKCEHKKLEMNNLAVFQITDGKIDFVANSCKNRAVYVYIIWYIVPFRKSIHVILVFCTNFYERKITFYVNVFKRKICFNFRDRQKLLKVTFGFLERYKSL